MFTVKVNKSDYRTQKYWLHLFDNKKCFASTLLHREFNSRETAIKFARKMFGKDVKVK